MNENIRKLCAGGIFCLWGTVTLFAQDTAHTNLELDYETDNRTVAIQRGTGIRHRWFRGLYQSRTQ